MTDDPTSVYRWSLRCPRCNEYDLPERFEYIKAYLSLDHHPLFYGTSGLIAYDPSQVDDVTNQVLSPYVVHVGCGERMPPYEVGL